MKQNAPQTYGRKEQSWFEACLGPKQKHVTETQLRVSGSARHIV